MKFNISYPLTGAQKCIEIDDDKKCAIFLDKRIGAEIEADSLGDEFKGYIFKIAGGNDKDGFPMMQGVMAKNRVRLLLSKGHSTYRPRRTGERKRKSVRGCIVGQDIRVLSLVLLKKGEASIPGLTDRVCAKTLGPKRASKIKKLFNLSKEDQAVLIKKNVVRRTWTTQGGKKRQKAPKVQRIVTEDRLRRKRIYKKEKKEGWQKEKKAVQEYAKLLAEWRKKKQVKAEQAEDKKKEDEKQQQADKSKKPQAPVKADDKKKTAEVKKDDKKVEVKKDDKKKVETKKPAEVKKPVEAKKPEEKKPVTEKPAEKKKEDKKKTEKK